MEWLLGIAFVVGGVMAVSFFGERGSGRKGRAAYRPLPDPDVRTRKVISESLDIAMQTKRRATAESRLQVAEDALDDLARRGKEIADDRINRHTLSRLREGLDRRFPAKANKKPRKGGAGSEQ